MPIESGPTTERCVRQGIFLAMCFVFFVLFVKDGFYGYAKNNREWAAEQLHQHGVVAEVRPNPEVMLQPLTDLKRHQEERLGERVSADALREQFGEPLVIEQARWEYRGMAIRVIVHFDAQDKVASIETSAMSGDESSTATENNERLTRERVAELEIGASRNKVLHVLREPTEKHDPTWWYVGTAVIGRFEIRNGEVAGPIDVRPAEHSETDIFWQKAIAAVLGAVLLWSTIVFVSAVRVRVQLDDQGLTYNGRLIPWNEMRALNIDDYRRKGWVELECSSGDRLRLDGYFFSEFRRIIEVICQRKGFEPPTFRNPGSKPATSEETAATVSRESHPTDMEN